MEEIDASKHGILSLPDECTIQSIVIVGLQRVGVWSGNEFAYFCPASTGTLLDICLT